MKAQNRVFLIVLVSLALINSTVGFFSYIQYLSGKAYLRGMSDAITLGARTEEKVLILLQWLMNYNRNYERLSLPASKKVNERDPIALLGKTQACGGVTNIFIHLVQSQGITAYPLLLLNNNDQAMHVVAEVNIEGRKIIADPLNGALILGSNGQPATKEQLADPKFFKEAQLPEGYNPKWTFGKTCYIRYQKIPVIGEILAKILPQVPRPQFLDNAHLRNTWILLSVTALLLIAIAFLTVKMKLKKAKCIQ